MQHTTNDFYVTWHAIKRFRHRVCRLSNKRIHAFLFTILDGLEDPDCNITFVWGGRPYVLVVRSKAALTILHEEANPDKLLAARYGRKKGYYK